jgi:hypothetical protein
VVLRGVYEFWLGLQHKYLRLYQIYAVTLCIFNHNGSDIHKRSQYARDKYEFGVCTY